MAKDLINLNFEDGFSLREAPEVVVANGWGYSYLSGNDPRCPDPSARPEFKPEQSIVRSGYSQRWFTSFARHFAAIHQPVEVTEGEWYTFSAWGYAISEPPGQLGVFCGANPWGADVFHRTTIWGKEQPLDHYREWFHLSVTFQAFGGEVLVALGSNNRFPTKNNTVYFDQCRFTPATPLSEPLPPPEGDFDYARLRAIVAEEIKGREPVTWPRDC